MAHILGQSYHQRSCITGIQEEVLINESISFTNNFDSMCAVSHSRVLCARINTSSISPISSNKVMNSGQLDVLIPDGLYLF